MDFGSAKKFAHPFTLLTSCQNLLEQLGPHKFLYGSDARAHKGREAFAALLFCLSMKKPTGIDWWFSQPDDTFPDFELMGFSDDESNPIRLHAFELVTIPDRCTEFDQALNIVHGKTSRKNYPSSSNVKLLIFINNLNSEAWLPGIGDQIGAHPAFQEIWTIHLKSEPNDNQQIGGSVIHRISPGRVIHAFLSFSDTEAFQMQPLPKYMEMFSSDGYQYVKIGREMQTKIREQAKKMRGKG
jgi:hypothetical protein